MLDDYIADCQTGIERWNRAIAKAGIDFQLTQPHKGFNRRIGEFAGQCISPAGEIVSETTWNASRDEFLPTAEDLQFITSLMQPSHGPGEYATWISPPRTGINNQPLDYEYVKIA